MDIIRSANTKYKKGLPHPLRIINDNKGKVVKMLLSQGFSIGQNSELTAPVPESGETVFSGLSMRIPSGLVPYCPVCGEPMTMNLRSDDKFVEDEGWRRASAAYAEFLEQHRNKRQRKWREYVTAISKQLLCS